MKRIHLVMILPVLLAPGVVLAHGEDAGRAKHPPAAKMDHSEPAADGHGAALGQPGKPTQATRTITVEARDDMRYEPSTLRIKPGETVRIRIKNVGKVTHEAVLGTQAELEEHAAMMRKFPHMEHDDPNQVVVRPGETGDLLWQFTSKPGVYDFACLVPGHYEAGMTGKIIVE